MASLDDFFAKKDKRKKGKSKQNFVTSELLAKTIEEQSAAPNTSAEAENKAKIDLPAAPTQEDEWKEEEEVVKDFEGLRVQKLDKEEGEVVERVQVVTEFEENFVEGEGVVKEASPWQPVTTPQPPDALLEEAPQPEPEPEKLAEKLPNVQKDVYVPPGARGGGGGGGREGGTYVPPHMKRAAAGGGGAYVPPGMRRSGMGGARGNRAPPDLKSNVAFPSLHDMAKKGEGRRSVLNQLMYPVVHSHSSTEKGEDFKEAQGPKTSRASDANYRVPGLELTNKFSGLEDD
ncbi:hypothetical protein GBAR_LOCUS13790 [Geodia barretti]|uniref:Protein CDV3 homolog n=2 Tax=Geodia barretti TaxID=519541 RepID=A0AA35S6Q2_GEOBA|nr:hypothetical protein GBAR_LOCUS13790 [Geodia barretti]